MKVAVFSLVASLLLFVAAVWFTGSSRAADNKPAELPAPAAAKDAPNAGKTKPKREATGLTIR